jgi:hypothetical protein
MKCKNCETESFEFDLCGFCTGEFKRDEVEIVESIDKLKFMCKNCSVEEVEELGDLCEYCMEEIDETDMRYCGDE